MAINVSHSGRIFLKDIFPEPVMPGVLIVEALAQTGAVAILSKPENKGRLLTLVVLISAGLKEKFSLEIS